MKTIELHIECYSGNNELAKLGIDTEETEWRKCLVIIDGGMIFYPASQGGTLGITANGDDFLFRESYNEIKSMLE